MLSGSPNLSDFHWKVRFTKGGGSDFRLIVESRLSTYGQHGDDKSTWIRNYYTVYSAIYARNIRTTP